MRPAEPPTDHDVPAADATPADPAAGDSGAGQEDVAAPRTPSGSWTFLSNHAHVLLCLAADPDQTLPAIAEQVCVTSRAVQLILTDLIQGGYVERTKVGRRNHYRVNADGHLRHPLEAHHRIADLIAALGPAVAESAGDTASHRRTG
jgi:hypothetical protein